jgi:ABC-2 type transport system ATP-binding protein
MKTPPVSVQNLSHSFGATKALENLSFDVAKGEIFGLIGADGAGKTTTLRILAGLIDPASGKATVLGHDPRNEKSGVRTKVGYMPQRYSLYGDLSIQENLTFFGKLFCLEKGEFRRRAEKLLAITQLEPFLERRADALSGGMYKKLALSCALLHEPEILLLDEPTNGVDPISRRELWDLMYNFRDNGMTIVVSTSYMDEAARSSRVGLIHRGKMLATGNPHTLAESNRTESGMPEHVLPNFEQYFLSLMEKQTITQSVMSGENSK